MIRRSRTVSHQPSQHDASRQNCFTSTKSTLCQSTELFHINQVNTMPVDRTVSHQPSQHDASRQRQADEGNEQKPRSFSSRRTASGAHDINTTVTSLRTTHGQTNCRPSEDVYCGVLASSYVPSFETATGATRGSRVNIKCLSRNYTWWPGIDQQIEDVANSCPGCRKHSGHLDWHPCSLGNVHPDGGNACTSISHDPTSSKCS